MCNSVVEKILSYKVNNPKKIALIVNETIYTYSELADSIVYRASELTKLGIVPKDTVILTANCSADYIVTYFAIHLTGAIAVPIYPNSSAEQIDRIASQILPKTIFTDYSIFLDSTSGSNSESSDKNLFPQNSSIADIIFTSGTTGIPKGVSLTHGNTVAGCENVIGGGNLSFDDVALLPVPLYHAYGLTTFRSVLFAGATLVMQNGLASLRTTYNNIKFHKITHIYLTPSSINVLIQQSSDNLQDLLGSIKKVEFCTAPLSPQLRQKLLTSLPTSEIYNSYGATEAARAVYLRIDNTKKGLNGTGYPAPNTTIRVVDPDNIQTVFPVENIGKVVLSGSMVSKGYLDDKQNEKSLIDSSYYTGDMGYLDSSGCLFLLGREDDLMNIRGEKVFPGEIERIALESGLVDDCACVGIMKDKDMGDTPILFVTGENINIEKLEGFLCENMERYKIPAKIIPLSAIPVNNIGKKDRIKLSGIAEEMV